MKTVKTEKYMDEYEKDTSKGYDMGKIIFGTIIVGIACYFLFYFVYLPFGMIYKIKENLVIGITVLTGVVGEIIIVLISKRKYESKDVDFDIDIGQKKPVEKYISPDKAVDSIRNIFNNLEYALKNNNIEAANQSYWDIMGMIKSVPIGKKEEITKKCADMKNQIDSLKKKFDESKAGIKND